MHCLCKFTLTVYISLVLKAKVEKKLQFAKEKKSSLQIRKRKENGMVYLLLHPEAREGLHIRERGKARQGCGDQGRESSFTVLDGARGAGGQTIHQGSYT